MLGTLLLRHQIGLVDLAGAGEFTSEGWAELWEEFAPRRFRLLLDDSLNSMLLSPSANNLALSPAVTVNQMVISPSEADLLLSAGSANRFLFDEP